MLKSVLAGTAAVMIAGTSLALAQHRPDGAQHWRPSAEDFRAFEEARLAGLKAGLALTADQEKNWPAFEQATREFESRRIDHAPSIIERRRSQPRADSPVERMTQQADALRDRSAALTKLAEATAPLYSSLDEAQRRRFSVLVHASHLRPFAAPQFRMQDHGPGRSDRAFRRTEDEGRALRSPRRGQPMPREDEDNL